MVGFFKKWLNILSSLTRNNSGHIDSLPEKIIFTKYDKNKLIELKQILGRTWVGSNLSIKHLATMIYRIIKCFHWDNLKTLKIKFTEIYKFQHKEICVKKLLWVYTRSLQIFQIAGGLESLEFKCGPFYSPVMSLTLSIHIL